jgi:hypothetical protein
MDYRWRGLLVSDGKIRSDYMYRGGLRCSVLLSPQHMHEDLVLYSRYSFVFFTGSYVCII